MKKMKRLLAVILASLMVLSSAVAGASAYEKYTDDALTRYDYTNTAVLTTEQYASMLLDEVDLILKEQNINVNELGIVIDLRSVNSAFSSIYSLVSGSTFNALKPLLGQLKDLTVNSLAKDKKPYQRSNGDTSSGDYTYTTDLQMVKQLLLFLQENRGLISDIVASGKVDLGTLGSILSLDIELNVEKMIRQALWDAAYPDTEYDTNNNVDTMLKVIVDNLVASIDDETLPQGVKSLLDINSTKTVYTLVDELLVAAYNDIAVPALNGQTMPWLKEAVANDQSESQTMENLFNTDYEVQRYTGNDIISDLNNVLGDIVNGVLKNYDGWVSGDNSKLTDNVVALAKYILKETDDFFFPDWQKYIATDEEIDAMDKDTLFAYIARSIINATVTYMYIPDDITTVIGVAWEAVRQLMAQFIPERDYSGEPKTVQGILDMLADYIAYSVNPGVDLNMSADRPALEYGKGMDATLTTAVQWLEDEPQCFVGLLGSTVNTNDGWEAIDDILFALIKEKSILPAKYANSGSETIIKDIIYDVLNGLLVDQDLSCITDLFVKNSNGYFANNSVKQTVIKLVFDVVNAILPGSIADSFYSMSLNDIVTNANLGTIVKALLNSLGSNNGRLAPPLVNILSQVMGLSSKPKFGKMGFSGPTKAKEAYTVKLTNKSSGVINNAYSLEDGSYKKDNIYYYYDLVDATAVAYDSAGNTSSVSVTSVSGRLAGRDSVSVTVTPSTFDTVVVLTVRYDVYTEDKGEKLTSEPLSQSFYTYYCSDIEDDSAPKIS